MKKELSSNFYFIFKWVIIISFVFYAVFPFLWLILASLKTNAELLNDPFKLPEVFQFKNYSNAIQEAGLGRLIINSLVISTSATFLNILFSSMCAFAIARHTFWGNNVLFLMITAGILVPLNALIIPYFAIINFLNLYDTRLGLILVYCAVGLPVSTFILTEFFKSIPKEIEEASFLDGCNFVHSNTGRVNNIMLNDGRHVASPRLTDGGMSLTAKGASWLHSLREVEFPNGFESNSERHQGPPWVVIDSDAVPFVKQGRNVFHGFIKAADGWLRNGMYCLVVDEDGTLVGHGKAMSTISGMQRLRKGIAVKVRNGIE